MKSRQSLEAVSEFVSIEYNNNDAHLQKSIVHFGIIALIQYKKNSPITPESNCPRFD